MDQFQYLLKRIGRCFLYSHYCLFMTIMISLISSQFLPMNSKVAKLALLAAAFLLYAFAQFTCGMAFGLRQFRATVDNSYRRKPDSRDLLAYYEKRDLEFAPLNGALIGFFSHWPLLVAYIVYAFTGKAARDFISYFIVYLGWGVITAPIKAVWNATNIYYALILIPITALFTFAGYMFSGARMKAQQNRITAMQESLKGE
ncbi:MAG: hypothetical protein II368_00335 [Clostridia bacterium]|nr:hypothetical protein [Clostridia bacterium]